jgi:hypothetical protein
MVHLSQYRHVLLILPLKQVASWPPQFAVRARFCLWHTSSGIREERASIGANAPSPRSKSVAVRHGLTILNGQHIAYFIHPGNNTRHLGSPINARNTYAELRWLNKAIYIVSILY